MQNQSFVFKPGSRLKTSLVRLSIGLIVASVPFLQAHASDTVAEQAERANVIVEFSVDRKIARALRTIKLSNVATGETVSIPLDSSIQTLSVPAGVYEPDFATLSDKIYGRNSDTRINAPENATVTVVPGSVTYLGHWHISQSKAHSGAIPSIRNRDTQLSIKFDADYQDWVAQNAGELMSMPLKTSRLGTPRLFAGQWSDAGEVIVSN